MTVAVPNRNYELRKVTIISGISFYCYFNNLKFLEQNLHFSFKIFMLPPAGLLPGAAAPLTAPKYLPEYSL